MDTEIHIDRDDWFDPAYLPNVGGHTLHASIMHEAIGWSDDNSTWPAELDLVMHPTRGLMSGFKRGPTIVNMSVPMVLYIRQPKPDHTPVTIALF